MAIQRNAATTYTAPPFSSPLRNPRMSPTTYFIPLHFTPDHALTQEPQSDQTPNGGGAPAPTPAPTTGSVQVPDPNGPTGGNTQGGSGGGAALGNDIFIFMAIFVALMLFWSMRRESKARKTQQAMLAAIKQGDQVVTSAGIHGKVHHLDGATVTLEIDTVRMTFDRTSIQRVVRDTETGQTA